MTVPLIHAAVTFNPCMKRGSMNASAKDKNGLTLVQSSRDDPSSSIRLPGAEETADVELELELMDPDPDPDPPCWLMSA